MEKCFIVYVTASGRDEAASIGKTAVEERLAACVNIISGMESFYWWEGKLESDKEVVCIFKTSALRLEDLIDRIKQLHSYSCPCIVAIPIEAGNNDFLQWIVNETSGS